MLVRIDKNFDFIPIGLAAAHFRLTVVEFGRLTRRLKVSPALGILGVPYYSAAQLDQISALIKTEMKGQHGSSNRNRRSDQSGIPHRIPHGAIEGQSRSASA